MEQIRRLDRLVQREQEKQKTKSRTRKEENSAAEVTQEQIRNAFRNLKKIKGRLKVTGNA